MKTKYREQSKQKETSECRSLHVDIMPHPRHSTAPREISAKTHRVVQHNHFNHLHFKLSHETKTYIHVSNADAEQALMYCLNV